MVWLTRSQKVELGRFHEPDAEAGASLPGLVVIHDVWGPSEHSRERRRRGRVRPRSTSG